MTFKHKTKAYAFAFAASGIFLFSDFYFNRVGRVFDYFFLFLIIIFAAFGHPRIAKKKKTSTIFILVLILPSLIIGSLSGSLLLASAIFSGLLVGYLLGGAYAERYTTELDFALRFVIIVSISYFVLQLLLQRLFNIYLDVHMLVGSIQSRGLNEDLGYFRPSGLFQEPNSFCTVMFCLISARAIGLRKVDWTVPLGLMSMIVSMSLWGIGAACLLWVLIYGYRRSAIWIAVCFMLFMGFLSFNGSSIDKVVSDSITIQRVLNIEEDSSRQARFGKISNYINYKDAVFGSGVSNDKFQDIAANSYGFLIYSFGFVGVFGFLVWLFCFERANFRVFFVVAFVFSTFPQFSYMYFWLWLALILRASSASTPFTSK